MACAVFFKSSKDLIILGELAVRDVLLSAEVAEPGSAPSVQPVGTVTWHRPSRLFNVALVAQRLIIKRQNTTRIDSPDLGFSFLRLNRREIVTRWILSSGLEFWRT